MNPKNQQEVLEFVALCKRSPEGMLLSPFLFNRHKVGHINIWRIVVQLVGADDKLIPITDAYVDRGDLPDGAVGAYYTIFGIDKMKVQRSGISYVESGKNEGRSNFTTPLTQAIAVARSRYDLHLREGWVRTRDELIDTTKLTFEALLGMENRGPAPWRVYMMALHKYEKQAAKIKFPCTVEPKLDGNAMIVVSHPAIPTLGSPDGRAYHIDCYSRGRETYENVDHLLPELGPLLQNHPGVYLVGELWRVGYNQQDCSGSSRRLRKSKRVDAPKMEFHVFDCFVIDRAGLTTLERQALLTEIMGPAPTEVESKEEQTAPFLRRVPVETAADKGELEKLYSKYMRAGFEGAVVYDNRGVYEFHPTREVRSMTALKLKPRYDAEWPIVGFEQGVQGKEVGAVIWRAAESDNGVQKRVGKLLPLEERRTFAFNPNMPYEDRYRIYEVLNGPAGKKLFAQLYGQLFTVQYTRASTDGLPVEPKGLRFRDEKINQLLFDAIDD